MCALSSTALTAHAADPSLDAALEEAPRDAHPDVTPDATRQVLALALALAQQRGLSAPAAPAAPIQLTDAQVRALPVSELRERLDEILLSPRADLGLEVLERCGLLGVVLPEVTHLVGFGEGHNRHKDVWRHTLRVVIQSLPRLAVRWAALFHDIGKPQTRSIDASGVVHFLHHAELGARMFKRLARRERLFDDDSELKDSIRFLIFHHQRAHQYDTCWTDSATRRFALEVGEHLNDLMALSRADMTTKRKEKKRRYLLQLKELQNRIEKLLAEDNKPKALPKGLGQALIDTFKLPPSKLVGDIRNALELAVEAGELPLQADFDVYLRFVDENRTRFGLL